MEKFIKGDVIVVPFPFSDLTHSKRRPALVITTLQGNDVILCQITSKEVKDSYAIKLKESDFLNGALHAESNIRPNRLFTADKAIILYKIGHLNNVKMQEVIDEIISLIRG